MTESTAGNLLCALLLDPLAYIIGLEGVALMRAFAGDPFSVEDPWTDSRDDGPPVRPARPGARRCESLSEPGSADQVDDRSQQRVGGGPV